MTDGTRQARKSTADGTRQARASTPGGTRQARESTPAADGVDGHDEDLAAIVRRFQRTRRAASFALAGLLVAVQVAAYLRVGFVPFLVVSAGLLVVWFARPFRVYAEAELATDRSLAATREHFRRPVNVLTALTLPPDASTTSVEVQGTVAAVDVEQEWWIVSGEVRLTVEEDPSGAIAVRISRDGSLLWSALVDVEAGADRTYAFVRTAPHRRLRPVGLVGQAIARRYHDRVTDHLGFEELEGSYHVGIR